MHGPRFHLDHAFTQRHLSAHLEGELAPRNRRRVLRHLADCRACGRSERSLRRLVRTLRSLASQRFDDVADRTVERVAAAWRNGGLPR